MTEPRKPLARPDLLARQKSLVKPILVGGSLQSAWVGGPLALAAIALVVVCIGTARESLNWLLYGLPVAGVIALPGVVAALIQLARRQWLEVTDDGFTVTRQGGDRRTYRDEEITGISQSTTVQSDSSLWRWVKIETHSEEGPATLEMSYPVPPGQPDPLFPLVDRVVRGMAARVVANADKGARIEGRGWHYDRHGLHVYYGPRKGVYPSDELTFVGVYDQKMCVWRGTEPEAVLRVPDQTVNAHTLGQIVWHFVENKPGLAEPLPGDPMGRLLTVRRGRDAALGWFFFVLAALTSLLYIPMVLSNAPLVGFLTFSLALAALASLSLWLILRGSYLRLVLHQGGIAQPGRGRSLLFTEIERMTWRPNFILLEPLPGLGKPPIRFSTIGMLEDIDMVTMRDAVATGVASRWAEELRRGPVRWTKRLRFLPGGLEYRPPGILGDGEPVTAPYHLTSYFILQLHMDLFVTGAPKPVTQQPLGETNFWPGLKLLDWIYADLRRQYEEQARTGKQEVPRPDFTFGKGSPGDVRIRASDGPERKITPPGV
jgi:hypothetical protein